MNTTDSNETRNNTRLRHAKMAMRAEHTEENFYALLQAMRTATVYVPCIRYEQGEQPDYVPVPFGTEGGQPLFPFFCDMETARAADLPPETRVLAMPCRDFLLMAESAEVGIVQDPTTEPLDIFSQPDMVRDILKIIPDEPEQEVHPISELIGLKQKYLRTGEQNDYFAFLAALRDAEVYTQEILRFTPDEEERYLAAARSGELECVRAGRSRMLMKEYPGQGTYIAVYLAKEYIPEHPDIPDDLKDIRLVCLRSNHRSFDSIIEHFRHVDHLAGIVIDPDSPTGTVPVSTEFVVCIGDEMPHGPIRYTDTPVE